LTRGWLVGSRMSSIFMGRSVSGDKVAARLGERGHDQFDVHSGRISAKIVKVVHCQQRIHQLNHISPPQGLRADGNHEQNRGPPSSTHWAFTKPAVSRGIWISRTARKTSRHEATHEREPLAKYGQGKCDESTLGQRSHTSTPARANQGSGREEVSTEARELALPSAPSKVSRVSASQNQRRSEPRRGE
jgi:hypothetical protein